MTLRAAITKKRFWNIFALIVSTVLVGIAMGQNLTYQQDPRWQPPQAAITRSGVTGRVYACRSIGQPGP